MAFFKHNALYVNFRAASCHCHHKPLTDTLQSLRFTLRFYFYETIKKPLNQTQSKLGDTFHRPLVLRLLPAQTDPSFPQHPV